MKEKLFALLVAKFAGVRKDGLTQLARALSLQAANDEEAEVLVSKLTKDQVDTFIKEFRADVDKEVSEGNKTYADNLKKKYDFVEKKAEPGKTEEPTPENPTNIQDIIKAAVSEAVKPLQEKLTGFEQGQVAKTRLQKLTEKLSGCKDEAFKARILKDFPRLKLDTEDEFTEYLTEIETDINTVNQNLANAGLVEQGQPIFGTPGKSEEDTFVQAMKAINETKE
ncbi:hypothetical protein DSECCO2_197690 [anaerobic digester metagenome]